MGDLSKKKNEREVDPLNGRDHDLWKWSEAWGNRRRTEQQHQPTTRETPRTSKRKTRDLRKKSSRTLYSYKKILKGGAQCRLQQQSNTAQPRRHTTKKTHNQEETTRNKETPARETKQGQEPRSTKQKANQKRRIKQTRSKPTTAATTKKNNTRRKEKLPPSGANGGAQGQVEFP